MSKKLEFNFEVMTIPTMKQSLPPPILKPVLIEHSKKIRNNNWWHFYVLLPLAIIGNIISYALALTLFGLLIYLSRSFLNGNQILTILYGFIGFLFLIFSHVLYLPIYDKLPNTDKWKDVN